MTTMTTEPSKDGKRPLARPLIIGIAIVVLFVAAAAVSAILIRNREARLIEAGQAAVAAGNWDEAVTALDSALATKPGFLQRYAAPAAALRGFAHYQLGNDEAALADFSLAMAETDDFVDLPAYQADIHYRQGAYDEAMLDSEAALAHMDDLPPYLQAQLHAQRALMLAEAGEETAVSSEIEAALTLADYLPDEMAAQLTAQRALLDLANNEIESGLADAAQAKRLGGLSDALLAELLLAETAVYNQQGNYETAVAAADQALTLAAALNDETLAEIYQLRAEIQYKMGNWEQAVAEADLAADYSPDLALPDALRAWQLYRQFAWDEALTTAEAALALDDEAALAYRVRGIITGWHGEFDVAFADLDKALKYDPQDVEALAMQTHLYFATGDEDAAHAAAARAAEIAPQSPAALWAQANVLWDDYQPEQAYTLLSQAIILDDQRPELYVWRSSTYLYSYQDEDLEADLDAALALYPDFSPAVWGKLGIRLDQYDYSTFEETITYLLENYPNWDETYNLASSYYATRSDDLEQALAYAEQAIMLNPNVGSNYVTRGAVYEEQDEWELTLADYEHALEVTPDSTRALAALAHYYSVQGDLDTAVTYMEQIYEFAPHFPDFKNWLAGYYADTDRLEKAWQMVNEVLAVDANNEEALMLRSSFLANSGREQQALNDLALVIAQNPKHARAYLLRARLMLWQGNLESAREDATLALAIDPYGAVEAHYTLALVALEEGDLDTAVTHLDEFIANSWKSGANYAFQAELYMDQDRIAEAMEIIETGLALEDEFADQLYLDQARAFMLDDDEENARGTLDTILETATNLDIISQAESSLVYLDSLPELVAGRRVYADETWGYTLSYSNDWIQETLNEDLFKLLLFQETDEGGIVFLVGILDGATGITSQNLADILADNLAGNPNLTLLPYESVQISGRNGVMRSYQLLAADDAGNQVPYLGRHYYLVVGDTAVLLSMEAPQSLYDELSPEFDAIVASFELLP